MIRTWCREHGIGTNSHPGELVKPIYTTHNGMQFCLARNYNKAKYPGIERVAWLEWVGQSLEVLSEACAYIRMTHDSSTGIVVMVRSPEPTKPSRVRT